ncbi:MAG: SDR family oxidoreductase [Acidobacteriota bacterium]|nr:SDR family oxidoreductase [Acidobacteriota bacterium]
MPISLKEKVALVVGASSGMGRETAILLAGEGAKVMASARRENRLRELRADHGVEIFAADASDAAQMDALAAATLEKFGRIDVLVYATGTNTPDRALTRLTPAIWDMMLSVNLNGAYYATQAVLPAMRTQKSGLIFYVSSRSAVSVDESGAAYQASKRGLAGLAGAVRLEEKDNGIRTCVVCPGLADTEIMEKRPVKPSAETLAKALRAEDIAELVVDIARLPERTWVPEVHLFPSNV